MGNRGNGLIGYFILMSIIWTVGVGVTYLFVISDHPYWSAILFLVVCAFMFGVSYPIYPPEKHEKTKNDQRDLI